MSDEDKALGWYTGWRGRLGVVLGLPPVVAFHIWALITSPEIAHWLKFTWHTLGLWIATLVLLLIGFVVVWFTYEWIRWGAVEDVTLAPRKEETTRMYEEKQKAKAEAGQLSKAEAVAEAGSLSKAKAEGGEMSIG